MNDDVKILREALAKEPTKEWFRAGRSDMQSYTIGGIPFKNLYNDEICKEREAAIVYGQNSLADSQLIAACSPDRIARVLEHVERMQLEWQADVKRGLELKEQLEAYESGLNHIAWNTEDAEGSPLQNEIALREKARAVLAKYRSEK